MPVTPVKPPTAAKPSTPTQGLSAAQKTKLAQRLLTANLPKEKQAALALEAEAAKEKGGGKLLATANDRLQLIATEATERAQVQPVAAFAKTLEAKTPAQLLATKQQVSGNKLLAVNRELGRRAHLATAAKLGAEAGRLNALKKTYAAELSGKSVAALNAERASLSTELTAQSAKAKSPTVERSMRELYAKRAVVDSLLPVPFDRQKMHVYANSLKTRSASALQTERAKVASQFAGLSSGAIRGSREQVREAQVRLAIIDAALVKKAAPVTPVDKTRNPGNVVFEGPGMFIENPANYPPSVYAARLRAAGVTWVAFQSHNPAPVFEGSAQAFVDGWRAAGFKVGHWGVSYGESVVADAVHGAQLTKKYGADFYIANCEGAFQAGQGDVARNKQFVDAFQAEATRLGIGDIPRALSSMGRVGIDHQPWIQNGWDAMPQAYWNDFSVYEPTACAKFYQDWGWPKDRVHLTIGTYSATGDGTPKTVADYVAPLKATGLKGFSFYLPENYLDDAGYQLLKDGIANGMNG